MISGLVLSGFIDRSKKPTILMLYMKNTKEGVMAAIESSYAWLFKKVFGADAFDNIEETYNNFGRAIAAYERLKEVTRFSSKFDVQGILLLIPKKMASVFLRIIVSGATL